MLIVIYMYTFIVMVGGRSGVPGGRHRAATSQDDKTEDTQHTHGSFQIWRQHGHPGVVLPLVISNLAKH